MKYLEAKDGAPRESITPKDVENKMRAGTRSDQKMDTSKPETLISGSHGNTTRTEQTGAKRSSPTLHTTEVTNLAKELNVDLKTVKGTGSNGTITEQDVRDAAK